MKHLVIFFFTNSFLSMEGTMQFIPCDVQTVCFGMAASMGALLLGAGTPGKRKSLPNARIVLGVIYNPFLDLMFVLTRVKAPF